MAYQSEMGQTKFGGHEESRARQGSRQCDGSELVFVCVCVCMHMLERDRESVSEIIT